MNGAEQTLLREMLVQTDLFGKRLGVSQNEMSPTNDWSGSNETSSRQASTTSSMILKGVFCFVNLGVYMYKTRNSI